MPTEEMPSEVKIPNPCQAENCLKKKYSYLVTHIPGIQSSVQGKTGDSCSGHLDVYIMLKKIRSLQFKCLQFQEGRLYKTSTQICEDSLVNFVAMIGV